MQSNIKKLPGSRIEFSVSVPVDEFKQFVDAALREIVAETELPGFRKGKAPAAFVRERIGEYALYERAANAAAKKYFFDAAHEHDWTPLEQPHIEVTKLAPNNEFEFTASFSVMPDVSLPDYKALLKGMDKDLREAAVPDEKIQETIAWLQKSRRTYQDAGHPVENGSRVTVDFSVTENGMALQDGTQENYSFVTGEGRVFPGFEEQITGLVKGAEKKFSAAVPQDYWNKAIAGKTVEFSVTVKNIQDVRAPALDDAFAQSLGKFPTMDALRQSIRQGLMQEERDKETQRWRMALLGAIDTQATMDVPDALVSREQDMMVHELEHSVAQTGIDWSLYQKQIGKTEEQMKQEFKDQAVTRVRSALILRAIADTESLEPTKEEVQQEVDRALLQYKTPEEAAKSIDVDALVSYTKNILTNEKVSRFLESCARAQK